MLTPKATGNNSKLTPVTLSFGCKPIAQSIFSEERPLPLKPYDGQQWDIIVISTTTTDVKPTAAA